MKFEMNCTFQCPFPIVYIVFRSEGIRCEVSKSSEKEQCKKLPQFFFRMDDPNTFLRRIVSAIYFLSFGKSLVEFRLLASMCEAWQ